MATEGVTVANAFVQVMPSMQGATDSISSAILPGVTQAGDKAGASFGAMFTGKMGAMLKGFGAAALGYLAFDALKDSFVSVEAGFNNVITATGATGEAAAGLKSVYLDVAGSVTGSFEEIGEAVGELNTRLGLNGEELEKASEQAMKFAKVNGVDAKTSIADVTRMMNNAGISSDEYSHVLDVLTVAAQQSGIDVNKLTETVTANAASFRQLGFSTEESIAMLAQFEKAGVDSSQVLAGMKKGVAEWTKEGKSAQEGFSEFVEGVQNGSISSADAIEIFGSRAGVAMYDAAASGQLAWDDMYAAISESSDGALDSVYNDTLTAGEKFDILGKKVQTGFFEIIEPLVDAISPYMDDIIEAISTGVEWIVNDVAPKMQVVATVIGEVIGIVGQVADALLHAGDTIGAWCVEVQGFFTNLETGATQIFTDIQNAITTAINTAVTFASNIVSGFANFIGSTFTNIQTTAGNIFEGIRQTISNAISAVHDFIFNAVSAIADVMNFNGVAETVSGVFSAVQSAIEDPIGTARSFIENAMSTIQGIFNGLDLSLPRIALPHFNVWGGQFPFGIAGQGYPPEFSVEWYAKGGFVDGATLIGAGEAGAEMILPQRGALMDEFADQISRRIGSGVDIHDCTFNVRKESDIRAIAVELNTLINRQTAGGIA